MQFHVSGLEWSFISRVYNENQRHEGEAVKNGCNFY